MIACGTVLAQATPDEPPDITAGGIGTAPDVELSEMLAQADARDNALWMLGMWQDAFPELTIEVVAEESETLQVTTLPDGQFETACVHSLWVSVTEPEPTEPPETTIPGMVGHAIHEIKMTCIVWPIAYCGSQFGALCQESCETVFGCDWYTGVDPNGHNDFVWAHDYCMSHECPSFWSWLLGGD